MAPLRARSSGQPPVLARRDKPAHGPDQVHERLNTEGRRESQIDEGERRSLRKDERQAGETRRRDGQRRDGRRGRGEQNRRRDIAQLVAVGITDDPSVRQCVNESRKNAGREVSEHENVDVAHDEGRNEDPGDADRLLDKLQPEEQVAPAHAVERLKVSRVDGQQRVHETVDLHEGNAFRPLRAEQCRHERGGGNREERHRGDEQEGRCLEAAAHERAHARDVVLHAGDRGEHHGLNRAVQHGADGGRVLLTLRDEPELAGREHPADEEVGEALVPLVEEARGEELPPEGEQCPRPRDVEDCPGPPGDLRRVDEAVHGLVGELLEDERPHARPGEGAPNADRRRGERGDDRGVEHLAELEVPRDDGDLDRVVGIHHKQQRQRAERPDEPRHGVECGDPGRRQKNCCVEGERDRQAEPEDRGAVVLRGVRRLDEGGVEAGLHDHAAEIHEHKHDREHAELLGREQSRHDDLDDHLNDGVATALEELPE